jgi:hypothetical protein
LIAESSNGGSTIPPDKSGLGLNDYNVAAQRIKTLPTVPKTRQNGATLSLTTCDEQHIGDDETKNDLSQALSLSCRQLGAESVISSSSMTVISQSKDLLSADSSGGGSADPLGNSRSERSKYHSPISDSQAGRLPPNSVVDPAASSSMMGGDARAMPASLDGKLSKQCQFLAESDASNYDSSSPTCSNYVASSDSNSDDMSDKPMAEESEMLPSDLHVQLTDLDIQQGKRSARNEVVYNESGHFTLIERQHYEYLPPARTKKDRAAAQSNDEEEPIVVRSSTRKRKQVQIFSPVLDTSQDEEEGVFGVRIEHLSKYTYDSLGRPTYRFSVLGDDGKLNGLCKAGVSCRRCESNWRL